ncbi:hypothetical protein P5673_006655 [Acropora cervicornis]|uniref:Aftiphilin n=1 Tax=Acropora cervicornis TaxID=6130 RepID=A0AAD9QW82_ACRCE|nr:hypothetical protein P5673_006655 [Acropora cervicornis]
MAWYYGVNNSQLYGSNFSTVLADAPPPLDDTFDEDDNEIVFKNDVNKPKKQIKEKENVSADHKKRHTDDDFNERSKVGSNVANGGNAFHFEKEDQVSGSLEKEDDFGDFASFADFGSAFGRDEIRGEQSKGWFDDEGSSGKSFNAVSSMGRQDEQPYSAGDEYDDFAAFQENETKSQGNFCNDLNQEDNDSVESNKIMPNNGRDALETVSDDFGDFTSQSVNATQSTNVWNASADRSKGTRQLHRCELDSEEISDVTGSKISNTNVGRQPNAAQCNGSSVHKVSGDHRVENKESGSLRRSLDDVSKADGRDVSELVLEQDNNLKTENGSSSDEFERPPVKDQESRSLSKMSAEVTDDQASETFPTHAKEARILNNQENGLEKGRSNNVCERSEDPQGLPENTSEKFANFHDNQVMAGSVDCNKQEGYIDDKINNSARMTSTCIDKATSGPSQRDDFLVESKHNCDADDDFGDFGAFQENPILEKDQTRHDSVPKGFQESTLGKENKNGMDDDNFQGCLSKNTELDDEREGDDFANFTTFNPDSKPSFSNVQSGHDDFGDFGTFNSKDIDSQQDHNEGAKDFHTGDNDNGLGDFGSFESSVKDPETTEIKNDFEDFRESTTKDSPGEFELNATASPSKEITDDFGDFGSFEIKNDGKDSLKSEDDADDFGEFGAFESKGESGNKSEASIGDISAFSSNAKGSQGNHDLNEDYDDFGSFKSEDISTDSPRLNNTDDFGDFGSFESKSQVVGTEDGNDDNFGDFGSFESNTKPSQQEIPSNNFGSFKGQDSCAIKNGDDDNNADFGTFESEEKSLDSSVKDSNISKTQNKEEDTFEEFRTSKSPEFGGSKLSSKSGNLNVSSHQTGGLSERTNQQNDGSKIVSFQRQETYVKVQRTQTASHFQPGGGVSMEQAGDPISVCFGSEQRGLPGSFQSDALLSKLDKGFHRVDQYCCQSQRGFLEPIKAGTQEKQVPNNVFLQDSSHADFILGNSLLNTASKSDSKALHEDLLGLDILSSSSEMKKGEVPKANKVPSTNMKKVWQHGGVTIPLSQGKRSELSATAKSVLEQLEDLTFMNSSVLMFPLKPE